MVIINVAWSENEMIFEREANLARCEKRETNENWFKHHLSWQVYYFKIHIQSSIQSFYGNFCVFDDFQEQF